MSRVFTVDGRLVLVEGCFLGEGCFLCKGYFLCKEHFLVGLDVLSVVEEVLVAVVIHAVVVARNDRFVATQKVGRNEREAWETVRHPGECIVPSLPRKREQPVDSYAAMSLEKERGRSMLRNSSLKLLVSSSPSTSGTKGGSNSSNTNKSQSRS